MHHPVITSIRSHWDSLCQSGQLPLRSAINPREIPDALSYMFILERLEERDFRIRIAGLTLCEMVGMEVRGMPVEAFFSPATRHRLTSVVEEILQRPTIGRLLLGSEDKAGHKDHCEMILLPLRSEYGDSNRVVGCLTEPENGFTAPVWFHVQRVDLEHINWLEEDGPLHGFAEANATYVAQPSLRSIKGSSKSPSRPQKPKRPDYLKLVD